MKWESEDEEFTKRKDLVGKKWLKHLKDECKGTVKAAKKDVEEYTEKVRFDLSNVVHTDKKSKDFNQVKEALAKFKKGTWKLPSKSRGNHLWRHYIHVDAKGLENHFKVVNKGDQYEFFAGIATGKPIPDSDSQESDGNDDGGDPDVVPAAMPADAPKDTSKDKGKKKGKDKDSDRAQADEAGPSGAQAGKAGKKRRR